MEMAATRLLNYADSEKDLGLVDLVKTITLQYNTVITQFIIYK